MRELTPCILSVSIVKVNEQSVVDMANLQNKMDENFEYLNHELSVQGFIECVRRFMKGEYVQIKRVYAKQEAQAYPMGTEHEEWHKLVAY